jgi:cellulose synthase/poly-beta-1,6-N-acetylglucosamine synthase-like glycosyltransferase
MAALSLLLGLIAVVLLLPTASDLISAARMVTRRRARPQVRSSDVPHLLFLVPAHNEEVLIADCLRSLRRVHYPAGCATVLVVADNCSDRTAELARAAGAECLERDDPHNLGKPRALAWAVAQLPLRQYDAVVIVDADTTVDPAFAIALASAAPLRRKVVQPFNDVGNRPENALTRMAGVLATAICLTFRWKHQAGLNVPVSAGMCIGSEVLATHGWNAFSLSEDWELYASLTAAGVPIDYVHTAHLYAQEARSLDQSASQRRRWTAGKVAVLARAWRPLLRSPSIAPLQKLDALAELSAPGPAVHLGLVVVLSAIVLLVRPPAAPALALCLASSLMRPVVTTLAAFAIERERWRAVTAFAFLPIYTLWRLWTLLGSVRMIGERRWVRTQRHAPGPATADGGEM